MKTIFLLAIAIAVSWRVVSAQNISGADIGGIAFGAVGVFLLAVILITMGCRMYMNKQKRIKANQAERAYQASPAVYNPSAMDPGLAPYPYLNSGATPNFQALQYHPYLQQDAANYLQDTMMF